ncbi:hypothetical protein BGZ65_007699, partial [Modicella reniformis]
MRLNMTSRTYDRLALIKDIQTIDDYAVAWSVSLRKLIYIGGKETPGLKELPYLNMLSYSDKDGWRNITQEVKGRIPASRFGACLLPAFGGSKMVLFGGFVGVSDIYILDVATMTWTRGPDAIGETRAYPACAVSNDQLVVWGGMTGSNPTADLPPLNSTIVFNLKTNKWTSTFSAPTVTSTRIRSTASPTLVPSAFPTEGSSTDDSQLLTGGLSHVIIIVAAVLGVAGLSLAVGAIFLCRMRRKVKQKNSQKSYHNLDDASNKTIAKNVHSRRDPQEPPANHKPVLRGYIPRNPQRCTGQFPLQDFTPEPHAILSSQSPQDPHLPVTAMIRSTTDKTSRDHQGYKYSIHEAMSPSTFPSQTQDQVGRPQQLHFANTGDNDLLN